MIQKHFKIIYSWKHKELEFQFLLFHYTRESIVFVKFNEFELSVKISELMFAGSKKNDVFVVMSVCMPVFKKELSTLMFSEPKKVVFNITFDCVYGWVALETIPMIWF